jgi:hypothetical protein
MDQPLVMQVRERGGEREAERDDLLRRQRAASLEVVAESAGRVISNQ